MHWRQPRGGRPDARSSWMPGAHGRLSMCRSSWMRGAQGRLPMTCRSCGRRRSEVPWRRCAAWRGSGMPAGLRPRHRPPEASCHRPAGCRPADDRHRSPGARRPRAGHVERHLAVRVEQQARPERLAGPTAEAGQHVGGAAVLQKLPRLGRPDGPPGDLLPDHEAAAGLLLTLPARTAVRQAVLADHGAGLGAAARARPQLDPLRAEVAGLQAADLVHRLAGEIGDAAHEARAVGAALLDLVQAPLPVAGQLGRGQRVGAQQGDDLHGPCGWASDPCRGARCTGGGSASR